ncbi:MAG TPA: LacI family DNA-binding transcriptional regulator [Fimbriimonas sp.]
MAVTLRDVAARAGVSPVVVSRVLHNRAQSIRVSEATAERVRVAAKELGYRVNVMARAFRQRQTHMIGVLHGVRFGRPMFNQGSMYFAALMDGIVEGAFRHEYAVTLCPKLYGHSPEESMEDGRFDGLVWYSTEPSKENEEMLANCSVPLVILHGTAAEGRRHPTVVCDNDGGVGFAVNHLFELGHRRIGFALDRRTLNGEFLIRYEAFRRHLRRLGVTVTPADLVGIHGGLPEIEEAMLQKRYTAIFAQEDDTAGRIMQAAQGLGISVPDELSIVGFDSTPFCDQLRPRLTSVRQPLTEMGNRAIDLLIQSIRGETIEQPNVVLPCSLDVRESTAPKAP